MVAHPAPLPGLAPIVSEAPAPDEKHAPEFLMTGRSAAQGLAGMGLGIGFLTLVYSSRAAGGRGHKSSERKIPR